MAGRIIQIEFESTLLQDAQRNASFCSALTSVIGGDVLCFSLLPEAQDNNDLFLSDIQITVYNLTTNIYAPGNTLVSSLTTALRNGGFFTLAESTVTLITDLDHPVLYVLIFAVGFLLALALATLCFYHWTAPEEPKPAGRSAAVVPRSTRGGRASVQGDAQGGP